MTSCQINVCVVRSQEERNIFSKQFLLGMEPKYSSNSPYILQKVGILQWLHLCCVCACVCVMAQHIHTLYYHRCTCVISVPLELCFHASVALIESNHGGRAPLWLKLVHDIVESVLVGSIDACFQERRGGGCNRAQSTVCPSGGETHDPASAGVCPGRLTLICAPDQHVMQFVKLSEIYLERGNIFLQSALAIKDVSTKESKHIIKENSVFFKGIC